MMSEFQNNVLRAYQESDRRLDSAQKIADMIVTRLRLDDFTSFAPDPNDHYGISSDMYNVVNSGLLTDEEIRSLCVEIEQILHALPEEVSQRNEKIISFLRRNMQLAEEFIDSRKKFGNRS